jgi:transposase
MRKSFDGLCGLVTGKMDKNPMSGDLYIFINRDRNRIKLLRWEPGGFVLFYKRLEKGTYELPKAIPQGPVTNIGYGHLAMIITGISMKNANFRTRFLQQNMV